MTSESKPKKHTISLFVCNKPGVLIRIALVFARRGYNIDSLVVSASNDPRYSTMNICATGKEVVLDQILKQLNKLVDVVHATDRTDDDIIQRELALIKVHCEPSERAEVIQLAHAMECATVDVSEISLTFQIVGRSEQLDSVNKVLEKYGVQEIVRTGKVLMARGEEITA
ncbi:MAG: acetolactate synthase small subunit [Spirochaetaceae bacterium]|nr:MAG: acetolactate synthase small subunit [Spirochaetaceae bacterium]